MVLQMKPEDFFRRRFCQLCGSSVKTDFRLPTSTPLSMWAGTERNTTVTANSTNTLIYDFNVPEGLVAFVDTLKNNMYNNYNIRIVIDGEQYKTNITTTLGTIGEPRLLGNPLIVMNSIQVYANNTGSSNITNCSFEIDGIVYDLNEFDRCRLGE